MMEFTNLKQVLRPEEKVLLDLPDHHSESEVYHQFRIQEKDKFRLIQDLKNCLNNSVIKDRLGLI